MTPSPGGVQQRLPRTIWMYWDQGEAKAPFLVRTCIDSWKQQNPDWELQILDQSIYASFPELDWLKEHRISLQHQSDLLRLQLLMHFGGVWADATLFCNRPLDEWLSEYYDDHFFAFSSIKSDRDISNWFLAGDSESRLLSSWRDAIFKFWQTNDFPQQNNWRRQLPRKLMSLRKRNLVSNDIWFSRFMLQRLKIFPYPVNMYLFSKVVHDSPELQAIWNHHKQLSDHACEYLQKPLGMNHPVTKESKAFLRNSNAPMYKLNWRQDKGKAVPGSNLDYLLKLKH